MYWRCFGASAIGAGHIDGGVPCQDTHALAQHEDLLIAVVCDGAGSAAHSEEGARLCADAVVTKILAQARTSACRLVDIEFLQACLVQCRERLAGRAVAMGVPACELACTLVGAMVWPDRGIFFHVGDGCGIVENVDGTIVCSPPENGEYANETWFVTDRDWADHFRVTPFTGKIKRLALMSDGAMPFVLDRSQRQFYPGFVDPVSAYLASASCEEGNSALLDTLAAPATHAITADDKTLVLAFPVLP